MMADLRPDQVTRIRERDDRSRGHQYAHDIFGATQRGHIRQMRKHTAEAFRHGLMWFGRGMQPESPRTVVFSLAQDLAEIAVRDHGVTRDDIQATFKRLGDDHIVDDVMGDAARKPRPEYAENPGHFAVADWEQYDAMIDTLSEESLRRSLKSEARIRAQAQVEAGILDEAKP